MDAQAMISRLDTVPNIGTAFFETARKFPDREVYSQPKIDAPEKADSLRPWTSSNYRQVQERVKKLAHYLRANGVKKGDRVAILSSSRPEWMEADIAILAIGAVTVSVYQSLPADDVGYILFDSGAKIVFAENQEQVDKLLKLSRGPIEIPATEDRDAATVQLGISKIICFESIEPNPLTEQFSDLIKGDESAEIETESVAGRHDLAALVYTSGTTGPPKGVMQTHHNHLSNVRQAWQSGLYGPDSSLMLFLPLAHSFARLMGFIGFLTPATLKFAGIADTKSSRVNPESVSRDISEAGATIVPVVPRLLEKMEAGIRAKANKSGIGGKILSTVIKSSEQSYRARQQGKPVPLMTGILYAGTSGIRQKIKEKLFGSSFIFAISGGAKLNPTVHLFFDALGIEILEGYGLTETCVATNINRFGDKKIGSVGPLLCEDIELKLGEDGEIMFRGPNITQGYYNRPTATRQSWDEQGWFHTGDLGSVDDRGFLSIVGRKKEILVTSYGKNIAPEDIESQIKSSPYISQAIMLGDGRAYCVALVTIDEQAVGVWAKKHGVVARDGLASDQRVEDLIWKEVEKVNAELASYETIKKIAILPEELTVENGMLTPTFKVKRKVVTERFQDKIESLYASDS